MLGECNKSASYSPIEAFDQHLNEILDNRLMSEHQMGDPHLSSLEEQFYEAFSPEYKFSESNWVSYFLQFLDLISFSTSMSVCQIFLLCV